MTMTDDDDDIVNVEASSLNIFSFLHKAKNESTTESFLGFRKFIKPTLL